MNKYTWTYRGASLPLRSVDASTALPHCTVIAASLHCGVAIKLNSF